MKNYYELVDSNKQKSALIIIGFVAFIGLAAYLIAYTFGYGWDFISLALIVSGLTGIGSYYYSDQIVLSISKARPTTRREFFDYYTVAENISMAARIPMPKLYVIDDSAMNAFATGRDPQHAVVCATTGILARLNRTELEGVIAHEMSHIRNYDIRLMGVVSVLVGMITLLADWLIRISWFGGGRRRDRDEGSQIQAIFIILGLVLVFLSPIIATIMQLAISRRREFFADASAAEITKYPEGLASALEKLSKDREPLEAANKATAHLFIVNPLKNRKDAISWFAGLFNTHPPIEERIRALRSL